MLREMQIIQTRILSVFNSVFTPYIDLNSLSLYTDMLYLICKIVRIYSVFLKTRTKYESDFDLWMNPEFDHFEIWIAPYLLKKRKSILSVIFGFRAV